MIIHNSLFSQSKKDQKYLFEIGLVDSLYSKTLDEYRKIWVHVPESVTSDKNKKYPVLIVLDGDTQLLKIRAILQQLERVKVPEMIIIGVDNNTNRLRDLTPTKPHNPSPASPLPGGGEKFTQFIQNELLPYVDSKYPTTPYRTFFGHSIGGLLVLNSLFLNSASFDNYIAIEPSLWRGGDYDYLKEYSTYLKNNQFFHKSLFVGVANTMSRLNLNLDTISVLKDNSRATEHIRHILTFAKTASVNKQNKLNFNWKYYDNEDHNSVVLRSTYDALCFLFSWYPENKNDLMKIKNADTAVDEALNIFNKRNKELSNYFGYTVMPEEQVINRLGYQLLSMGQSEKSYAFFKMNIDYYPKSPNVYDSMADYFESEKDKENALKYVRIAYEISGEDYYKDRIKKLESNK